MCTCNNRDQVVRTARTQGWDAFERPTPHHFTQAVARADKGLVIDVGANTGFYTLLALAASCHVTVAAYEPLPAARKILKTNLALNSARRRVTISPYAVSNANASGTLFIPDQSHGLIETSASVSATFKKTRSGQHRVTLRTLDSLHARANRIAVIKIDAESHDLQVLQGAETILQRHRPTVFVEVLLGADEHALTELLQRCRYQDIVLHPDGASAPSNQVTHHTQAWNHMWQPL